MRLISRFHTGGAEPASAATSPRRAPTAIQTVAAQKRRVSAAFAAASGATALKLDEDADDWQEF
jgi:hypothetical protein